MPSQVERRFGRIERPNRLLTEFWPAGQQLRERLSAGETILAGNLMVPPDARAGDSAVYRVQRGAVLIEMDADVMGATYIDDVARVRLRHSGEIVYGRMQAGNIVVPCSDDLLPDRSTCSEQ